ncbi:hypothetical protein ACP70R_050104 [Stipagrostis hirtigluma subsp. patula]
MASCIRLIFVFHGFWKQGEPSHLFLRKSNASPPEEAFLLAGATKDLHPGEKVFRIRFTKKIFRD